MASLKLEIVTPTGPVYSQDVDMVTLPGGEGEMGIYPMHAPLITLIGNGEIVARRGGQEDRFLITGGCADITQERVAILTVFATSEDSIDETEAEKARERAEARLRDETMSPEETAMVQSAVAHSLAQLNFKRRHRH
jgi:F-type H+-transporting ATPase subunit epsilon